MRTVFVAALLIGAIAACAGANPPATSTVPTVAAKSPKELMLVTCADCGRGRVYYYDADRLSGPRMNIPVENAFALGIDDDNDLYVSGGGNRGYPVTITEILPDRDTIIYSDQIVDPVNVVPMSGANPPFYVANYHSPEELFFPGKNRDRPHGYDDPNLGNIGDIAVDANGNAYVGGMNGKQQPEIDVIPKGGRPANLHLHLVAQIYALNLDTHGNLVAAESNVGVAVFHPTKPRPFLWFDRTTPKIETHPVSITFGDGGERVYIMDDQYIKVYDYVTGQSLWQYQIKHSLVCCTAQVTIEPRLPLFDPNAYSRTHPGYVYWTDSF
jgi:hypothetical protein